MCTGVQCVCACVFASAFVFSYETENEKRCTKRAETLPGTMVLLKMSVLPREPDASGRLFVCTESKGASMF